MFRFKQFSIEDKGALMKIGTDSVLLAAWIKEPARHILDIGTGCGLLSIMLAHKTDAEIESVEIDTMSARQASENVSMCKMTDRIKVHNISFTGFISSDTSQYDLIVTNPPYFNSSLKSDNMQKNLWRHTDSLTHETILHGVRKLLSADGYFYLVLPFNICQSFIDKALSESLYIIEQLEVIPKENKPVNRILLKLSKHKSSTILKSSLTIRHSDSSYTQEYKTMTKDYYLNF